ncbi:MULTISPECIES: TetR/AcrR family transcriptional regulator [unclassified Saccharicrinis]|uniref:TetR/AcrR family transcriptional regulator n=1 Tax=unclassified Saccharicrinis TaxID=2646859 RepID=UPI003D3416FB
MARIPDQTKMNRLKQTTMNLVVERGYGGASIALIAKQAKISTGYFYMHYKGKYEMVNTILKEVYEEVFCEFEKLMHQGLSFMGCVEAMLIHFIGMANEEPIKVKFLYVLTNSYSFKVDDQLHEHSLAIIHRMKEKSLPSDKINKSLTVNDLYFILFITVLQYINHHYKYTKQGTITRADIDHLFNLLKKLLT